MARQQKIVLAGTLNNLIFYESWGKAHVRMKPVKVRQTKATRASALKFGRAARISRILREGISPILPDYKKRKLMHRVNEVILKSLPDKHPLNITLIKGFEFYEDRSFKNEFGPRLNVEWKDKNVTINVPELIPVKHVIAKRGMKTIQLQFAITGCDLKTFTMTGSKSTTIDIAYNNDKVPAQQVSLPFVAKAGSLSIVAAVMQNGINKETKDSKPVRQWNPAGIICAYYK